MISKKELMMLLVDVLPDGGMMVVNAELVYYLVFNVILKLSVHIVIMKIPVYMLMLMMVFVKNVITPALLA